MIRGTEPSLPPKTTAWQLPRILALRLFRTAELWRPLRAMISTAVQKLQVARASAQLQHQAALCKSSTWEEPLKTCGIGAVLASLRLARCYLAPRSSYACALQSGRKRETEKRWESLGMTAITTQAPGRAKTRSWSWTKKIPLLLFTAALVSTPRDGD